jgi:signal transduction histidine kinase
MKESDSSDIEGNYKPYDWKSQPPEDVLSDYLHEIRTPLSIIRGYVGILSNDAFKEKHPLALESISKCAERIEELNEHLIDYMGELRRKKKNQ